MAQNFKQNTNGIFLKLDKKQPHSSFRDCLCQKSTITETQKEAGYGGAHV
jgi:hypothetical protein